MHVKFVLIKLEIRKY